MAVHVRVYQCGSVRTCAVCTVCMPACVCVCVCVCACMRACVRAYVRACVSACMCAVCEIGSRLDYFFSSGAILGDHFCACELLSYIDLSLADSSRACKHNGRRQTSFA